MRIIRNRRAKKKSFSIDTLAIDPIKKKLVFPEK